MPKPKLPASIASRLLTSYQPLVLPLLTPRIQHLHHHARFPVRTHSLAQFANTKHVAERALAEMEPFPRTANHLEPASSSSSSCADSDPPAYNEVDPVVPQHTEDQSAANPSLAPSSQSGVVQDPPVKNHSERAGRNSNTSTMAETMSPIGIANVRIANTRSSSLLPTC